MNHGGYFPFTPSLAFMLSFIASVSASPSLARSSYLGTRPISNPMARIPRYLIYNLRFVINSNNI